MTRCTPREASVVKRRLRTKPSQKKESERRVSREKELGTDEPENSGGALMGEQGACSNSKNGKEIDPRGAASAQEGKGETGRKKEHTERREKLLLRRSVSHWRFNISEVDQGTKMRLGLGPDETKRPGQEGTQDHNLPGKDLIRALG